MKTSKLILATLVLASLSPFAVAGPGPQFWAQQSKNQLAQKASNNTTVDAGKETQVCGTCSCCSNLKKS